jgi:hypothetical protein
MQARQGASLSDVVERITPEAIPAISSLRTCPIPI